MAADIKLDTKEGKFKFRVCGLLCEDGKYLTVRINQADFYCLPGGHVELGEDTEQAVLREMKEELGFAVEIVDILAVMQNFFPAADGRIFHELAYYYLVCPKNKTDIKLCDYTIFENDKGTQKQLDFKWFTLNELKKTDFRPHALIDCIENGKNLYMFSKQ